MHKRISVAEIELDDATIFDSQISCVFKHPEYEDLYIAMADRWLVDLADDLPSGVEYYAAKNDMNYPMSMERREAIKKIKKTDISKKNISIAEYVWLPIKFENDVLKIYWHDEWKIEDGLKL